MRRFGVTALNVEDVIPRSKVITADINIFLATEGYVVIYFDKRGVQATKAIKYKSDLLHFIESYPGDA